MKVSCHAQGTKPSSFILHASSFASSYLTSCARASCCFQHHRQLPHSSPDLAAVDGGEAELQAVALERRPGVVAQRRHLQIAGRGGGDDGLGIDTLRQPAGGLQAGFDVRQLEQAVEALLRALHEDREALGVDLAHAAKVPTEMPGGDEVADDGLVEQRRGGGGGGGGGGGRVPGGGGAGGG